MKKSTRAYHSSVRRKQAEDTRNRIAGAAEILFKKNGYADTTIGAVAAAAGVAGQTVYAVFNSKQGILTHILRKAYAASSLKLNFKSLAPLEDISEISRELAALITRRGDEINTMFNTMGGFDLLYPELASLVAETDRQRRESLMEGLREATRTRCISLTPTQEKIIADIFLAFTDNKLYHSLVVRCGWSPEQYEKLMRLLLETIMRAIAPEMAHSFA